MSISQEQDDRHKKAPLADDKRAFFSQSEWENAIQELSQAQPPQLSAWQQPSWA
jgi:hypothetical protein